MFKNRSYLDNSLRKKVFAGMSVLMLSMCAMPVISDAHSTVIQIRVTDKGFHPNHIEAVAEKPVNLRITNQGAHLHEFCIPQFYIYSENLEPGQSTTISFTPSQTGHFEMMSDPDGTNSPEFKGSFTVTAHP